MTERVPRLMLSRASPRLSPQRQRHGRGGCQLQDERDFTMGRVFLRTGALSSGGRSTRLAVGGIAAITLLASAFAAPIAAAAAGTTSSVSSSQAAPSSCDLCLLTVDGVGLQMNGDSELQVTNGELSVDSASAPAALITGDADVQTATAAIVGQVEQSPGATATPPFETVPAPGAADPFIGLAERRRPGPRPPYRP